MDGNPTEFLQGSSITVSDLLFISSVERASLRKVMPHKVINFPNILKWYKKMFEVNEVQ